jgi:hypothetical protein
VSVIVVDVGASPAVPDEGDAVTEPTIGADETTAPRTDVPAVDAQDADEAEEAESSAFPDPRVEPPPLPPATEPDPEAHGGEPEAVITDVPRSAPPETGDVSVAPLIDEVPGG